VARFASLARFLDSRQRVHEMATEHENHGI